MQSFPSDVLNNIRRALEEEKTRIMAQVAQLAAQDPFTDTERVNDNAATDTEASEENDHERYAAMVGELKGRVQAIDDALIRVGNGTYGYCVSCSMLIDTDRLAILPTATLCLDCEKKRNTRNG
ncbi:MAG: TraR/DksA C4-type zinc finger protein [Patescibacteria group bacterium]